MRNLNRKLAPIAMLIAAPAFATSAHAQVEVFDEQAGEPCGEVIRVGHAVEGGCVIHIVAEQETEHVLNAPMGPIVIGACEEDFEVHVGGDGEGYADVIGIGGHTGQLGCTRTSCDEAEPSHETLPWRVHIREAPNVIHIEQCWRSTASVEGTAGTLCIWEIPWSQEADPHRIHFDFEAGIPCENFPPDTLTWFGHWHTESEPYDEIVISH